MNTPRAFHLASSSHVQSVIERVGSGTETGSQEGKFGQPKKQIFLITEKITVKMSTCRQDQSTCLLQSPSDSLLSTDSPLFSSSPSFVML